MRINILLPGISDRPVGGFKVQYEYANRFSAAGHDVVIYQVLPPKPFFSPRGIASFVLRNVRNRRDIVWFRLNSSINCRFLPELKPYLMRKADITVLSSYHTSEKVEKPTHRTGPLTQIVYDYEAWATGSDAVKRRIGQAFQRDDVHHVATSQAVADMLTSIGVVPVAKIPCGISLPGPLTPLPPTTARNPIVGFALRQGAHRGIAEMVDAMDIVRAMHPDVSFECFGDGPDELLPPYVLSHGYLSELDLVAFYQRAMIFVAPSYAEGFGLPAAEAMANGAAVIVADNGGSADFALHEDTALVVPPKNAQAIADAIVRLLQDENRRASIVSRGMAMSRTMTWSDSAARLMELLEGLATPSAA